MGMGHSAHSGAGQSAARPGSPERAGAGMRTIGIRNQRGPGTGMRTIETRNQRRPGRAGAGMRIIGTRSQGTPDRGATRSFFAGQRPALNPLTGPKPRADDQATARGQSHWSSTTQAPPHNVARDHPLTAPTTTTRAHDQATAWDQPHWSSTTQARPQNVDRDHLLTGQRQGHTIKQQPGTKRTRARARARQPKHVVKTWIGITSASTPLQSADCSP